MMVSGVIDSGSGTSETRADHPSERVTLLRFPGIEMSRDGVIAAVATRQGGVSRPPYDSLNLSFDVGDHPGLVQENRRRLARALGLSPDQLATVRQVHGRGVAIAGPEAQITPPEADILLTGTPGRALFMRFADCVPVLLWDPVRRVAGIAHAGWRGCYQRVPATAVAAMADAFGTRPKDLRVAIGPCIGPCCYQVGDDVASLFTGTDAVRVDGVSKSLDLRLLVLEDLKKCSVPEEHVEMSNYCTACRTDLFFSHRASGGKTGRFGAVIALLP